MTRRLVACIVLALAALATSSAAATGPSLHLTVFLSSDLPLGQIVWSGTQFLYVGEGRPTAAHIESSDASGHNVANFATAFDQGGEEMRCLPAPVRPAYWPKGIYCHTPDNRIVRLAVDGSSVTEFARLPVADNSDGALAFDTVGRFGYALLAASGGSSSDGGQVFAIRKSGKVDTIGSYPGPGGAENIVVAPARFGAASGQVILALDKDHGTGTVLAIDRKGTVRTLASGLGNGLNPIVVVEASPAKRAAGLPAAGVYLADTLTQKVYFAPASALKSFAGSILVGTELTGQLWLVRPSGSRFQALSVASDLPTRDYNFEGSAFIP